MLINWFETVINKRPSRESGTDEIGWSSGVTTAKKYLNPIIILMTSPSHPSGDKNTFLHTYDSSDMYSYVMKNAWIGTAIGTASAGALSFGAYKYTTWFKRYTNYPTRAFILFAGAATGFTLASDWAMVHFHRYMDRPEMTGFARLKQQQEEREAASQGLQPEQVSKWDIVGDWASKNRLSLIGGVWLATISSVLYRDFANPNLTPASRFGHARIAAQFVTLGAVLAAVALGDSPNKERNDAIAELERQRADSTVHK